MTCFGWRICRDEGEDRGSSKEIPRRLQEITQGQIPRILEAWERLWHGIFQGAVPEQARDGLPVCAMRRGDVMPRP